MIRTHHEQTELETLIAERDELQLTADRIRELDRLELELSSLAVGKMIDAIDTGAES